MKSCPRCDGKGESFAFINGGEDISTHRSGMVECDYCKGSGSITNDQYALYLSGKRMRDERVQAAISLHEAAAKAGISAAQLSAIESGRVPQVLE